MTSSSHDLRPSRLTGRFERSGDRLFFVHRPRQWTTACFLGLWLTGWTVGCVFLAEMVWREQKPFMLLFAVPFWASWVAVFCCLAQLLLLTEKLVLDSEGIVFTRWAGIPLGKRVVPLPEIQGFNSYWTVTDSESGTSERGIEVRTLGEALRFAQGLPGLEHDWVEKQLNDHLAQLGASSAKAAEPAATELPGAEAAKASPAETRLALGPRPVEPPSDCRWIRHDDAEALVFSRRGRLSLDLMFGLLFINAFWNGIVSVFVCHLFGGMGVPRPIGAAWWGLFVFLIPFEAIGLVMFTGLLAVLGEPFHERQWSFGGQVVRYRTTWLGLGPAWTYHVLRLHRLKLRQLNSEARARRRSFQVEMTDEKPSFELAFLAAEYTELCAVTDLTEGEARWIGDNILRERAGWFR